MPHRQIVLAVPKMLRICFRYNRRLLGTLCRVASRVITKSFRALAGREQFFRHRVLKMMLRVGLVDQKRVRLLLSWRHSGFNVGGPVRVRAGDAKGIEVSGLDI